METFATRVNRFNASLHFGGTLPAGIEVMNPFRENKCALPASQAFYNKFYNDNLQRGIILGINPGRFGAGITGVPFTDPKRLAEFCHIKFADCPPAHEPSSQFIYEVIQAFGGVELFYSQWYINSICPLGFIKIGARGKPVNYNFYDNAALENTALPFILRTMPEQLAFGIRTATCICLGRGKNAAFLQKINDQQGYFKKIIALDHPRYIMQYKTAEKSAYIDKYLQALASTA